MYIVIDCNIIRIYKLIFCKRVKQCNNLDLILHHTLKWRKHINHTFKKLSTAIGVVYRLKHAYPEKMLLILCQYMYMLSLTVISQSYSETSDYVFFVIYVVSKWFSLCISTMNPMCVNIKFTSYCLYHNVYYSLE